MLVPCAGALCRTLGVSFPGSLAQLLFYMCSTILKCKTLKSFVLLNVPKVHPLAFYDAFKRYRNNLLCLKAEIL